MPELDFGDHSRPSRWRTWSCCICPRLGWWGAGQSAARGLGCIFDGKVKAVWGWNWCDVLGLEGNSFLSEEESKTKFWCMPTWVSTLSSYSGPESMSLRQMSGQCRLCRSPLASSYNRHETTMLSPGDRRQLGALLAPGRAGQNPTVPLQDRAGVLVHPLPPECPSGQHRCEGVCGRPPQARLPQCGWGFHQAASADTVPWSCRGWLR